MNGTELEGVPKRRLKWQEATSYINETIRQWRNGNFDTAFLRAQLKAECVEIQATIT
jgi:hypothetical protein